MTTFRKNNRTILWLYWGECIKLSKKKCHNFIFVYGHHLQSLCLYILCSWESSCICIALQHIFCLKCCFCVWSVLVIHIVLTRAMVGVYTLVAAKLCSQHIFLRHRNIFVCPILLHMQCLGCFTSWTLLRHESCHRFNQRSPLCKSIKSKLFKACSLLG